MGTAALLGREGAGWEGTGRDVVRLGSVKPAATLGSPGLRIARVEKDMAAPPAPPSGPGPSSAMAGGPPLSMEQEMDELVR